MIYEGRILTSMGKCYVNNIAEMKESRMLKEDIDLRFRVAAQKGFIAKYKILKASEIQINDDVSIGKHRVISRILLDVD